MTLRAWFLAVLIGFVSNVDNLHAGMLCRNKDTRIPLGIVLIMPALSFACCAVGSVMARHASAGLSQSTLNLASVVIIEAVGLWTIRQSLQEKHSQGFRDEQSSMGFSEFMFLALADLLCELCVGFGVGFARINFVIVSCFAGLFTLLCLTLPSLAFGSRLQSISKHVCILSAMSLMLLILQG